MGLKYKKRKPDFEDEKIRAWKPTKEEQEEIESKNNIKVKIGKFDMILCEFSKVTTKRGRLVFGYKIKDDNMIMYYIPKKNKKKEKEKVLGVITEMAEAHSKKTGITITLQDAHEFLNHIIKNQEKIK